MFSRNNTKNKVSYDKTVNWETFGFSSHPQALRGGGKLKREGSKDKVSCCAVLKCRPVSQLIDRRPGRQGPEAKVGFEDLRHGWPLSPSPACCHSLLGRGCGFTLLSTADRIKHKILLEFYFFSSTFQPLKEQSSSPNIDMKKREIHLFSKTILKLYPFKRKKTTLPRAGSIVL